MQAGEGGAANNMAPPTAANRQTAAIRRSSSTSVRHKIKPLYLFEASMRAWLVTGPRLVSQLLPSIHRVIGLGFMYMMLQVLALLWAFLLNAASSVALDISGLAARHALDFTLDVSLVRAFATFYVVYGTFR
eukprot:9170-Heterococcus_DN1.PRE.5